MRILGVRRLSRDTDASTSVERQGEAISAYAKAYGHEVIHLTSDTDVSGAISPFDRDDLGPWLTDPAKLAQWDAIAVAKIDRLSRSLYDFTDFMRWAKANGKTLISVGEGIDFSTPVGKLIGNILAMFAEFERERMSERRADSARKARMEGRYDGGRGIPPGYMAENGRFVKKPGYSDEVAQMAKDVISGHSLSWVARRLNAEGVATPAGAKMWTFGAVRDILTNPGLAGMITMDGKIIRGEDGMPRKFTDDPILTDDEWALLSATLEKRATPKGERKGGFMLTRVAYCGVCGLKLYGQRKKNRDYDYYLCETKALSHLQSCGMRMIRSDELEECVIDAVIRNWGDVPLYRKTTKRGSDPRPQLANVERTISEIEAEVTSGAMPAASAARMLASLEADRERLAALPVEPEREEWEPAGVTVAEHWATLETDEAKGHLLRTWGVRTMAAKDPVDGKVSGVLQHGQPEGFEQASGLLLPHWPEDHEGRITFLQPQAA